MASEFTTTCKFCDAKLALSIHKDPQTNRELIDKMIEQHLLVHVEEMIGVAHAT